MALLYAIAVQKIKVKRENKDEGQGSSSWCAFKGMIGPNPGLLWSSWSWRRVSGNHHVSHLRREISRQREVITFCRHPGVLQWMLLLLYRLTKITTTSPKYATLVKIECKVETHSCEAIAVMPELICCPGKYRTKKPAALKEKKKKSKVKLNAGRFFFASAGRGH